ncbi:hypothetical protein GCM10011512_19300 [Tersicoccus solisilvae]|uniref:Abi-like protein n=1 Tax=Tersicoccus solisilvae TaxID=1882339 RepID=A0ABQ1P8W8_9MICC|nr:Abi family protein [Tersicoccus solisilvae]GGC92377.1 hypothetical protein GCM10011512_19300 [Tersicoccus solisilvae]
MTIYPPVRDEMIRLLSVSRLEPYRQACSGDVKAALALYRWNLELSSALFGSIHYFEVALRNTIDAQLTKDYGQATAWFDRTPALLNSGGQKKVREAKNRISRAGHLVTAGRVVAELELGFWWTVLSSDYNRSLWAPSLKFAFVNARRERLHSEIDEIRKVRNRIAHHEPLFTRSIEADYERLLATAERIDTRLAWWIDATSDVSNVLLRRPSAP